jgi:hypothetical protein
MVSPGDFCRVALCIQLFSGQPLLRTPVKQERKCFSSDLGTLPAILGAGYLSAHLSFAFKSSTFRRLSGSLVMLYGVWTVAPLVWMI